MHITTQPHYLRATVVCTAIATIIPAVGAILIALDMHGRPVEASEVQGSIFILLHAIAAVFFVVVAYPIAGWRLFKKQALSRSRFYKFLFFSLAGASFAPATALAFMGLGTNAFLLVPVSFAILALLALPLRPVWLRFAQ